MKLLITGAKGQLGLDLHKECVRRGIQVVATDIEELDITQPGLVRQCLKADKPDGIINCAAYNDVDRAESDWEAVLRINVEGPKNLATAAEEWGIPMVHFGSDYVFDGAKGAPYRIDDPPNPVSKYGESKRLGEEAVRAKTERHFVIRLSWVFGAGNVNFPKKVLQWAGKRSTLQIVDDQISGPSYTVDLAPAILDLLDTGAYGLYHMSNRGFCSRYDWARLVAEVAGLEVKVVPTDSATFPTPAKRPGFSALDPWPLPNTIGRELPDWQDATRRFLREIGSVP